MVLHFVGEYVVAFLLENPIQFGWGFLFLVISELKFAYLKSTGLPPFNLLRQFALLASNVAFSFTQFGRRPRVF